MNSDVRALYTTTLPLGPHIVADEHLNDPSSLRLLFDPRNKLVSQLNHEKALIIGRKGAGKTTLLTSVLLSEPKAQTFYLPSSGMFARIMREINILADRVTFVEQVSRLWEFVLWGVVFTYVAENHREPGLASYCKALGLKGGRSPYELIEQMLSKIAKFPPKDWPIPEKIAYKKIGNLSFLQAKQIAVERLKREKLKIFLLMDSLEEFKLQIPSFGPAGRCPAEC